MVPIYNTLLSLLKGQTRPLSEIGLLGRVPVEEVHAQAGTALGIGLLGRVPAQAGTALGLALRVAGAAEGALRLADVCSRGGGAAVALPVDLVTTPALASVLDTGVLVHPAGLEALLLRHVGKVDDLLVEEPARGRLRHAAVVAEVGVARVERRDDRGAGGCRRGCRR